MLVIATVAAVIMTAGTVPYDYYASRYDHVDVTTILNNRRMVNYYAKCLLSEGPCPPEGSELKRILPEALQTNCDRCTEKQKTTAYISIKRLKKEYPKIWDQLSAVWDPDGRYIEKFQTTFENRPPSNGPPPSADPAVLSVISNRFGDNETGNNDAQPPLQRPSYVPISTISTSTTVEPVSTSTSTPFSTSTSRPVSTSTNRPFSTATSRPVSTSTSRPFSTSTSRPVRASTSGTFSTSTSTSTSRPFTASTSSTTTGRAPTGRPTDVVFTKTTNSPTNTVIGPARPQQFPGIAANIQATVTFMAAIKHIVIQLYQHKLDALSRILSG